MSRESSHPHNVAVLALDAVVPMDLAAPTQVFGYEELAPYQLTLCGRAPGPVMTTRGFAVVTSIGLEALQAADTVVVPGFAPHHLAADDPVLDALREAHARNARIVSICTGAFALAAAGLLDGRRATTHWLHADELAERWPLVNVTADVLYVHDEPNIATSAGVAAGIDLCLHLVRVDHGAALANAIARRMVVAPHRAGGQAQYVEMPLPDDRLAGGSLEPTRTWALERLHEPIAVRDMARHALVSERTFARHFVAETGTTPLRWLHTQRLLRARELLERTQLPIEEVARRSGFGTATSLRTHLARNIATTPTAYRTQFARDPA
ncbi:MAG: DJ-1/PfpI family protein [Solirubrobacteraceae bacterium]|jgi:transcriptional regulator GlxA family with amidase domain